MGTGNCDRTRTLVNAPWTDGRITTNKKSMFAMSVLTKTMAEEWQY